MDNQVLVILISRIFLIEAKHELGLPFKKN